MTPEGKVTAAITKFLSKEKNSGRRLWFVKLHGGPYQRAGMPDLVVVYAGGVFFFEVKSENGEPTRLQLFTIEQLKMAGATAMVVRSVDEVKRVLGV
jgi:hypothetical protein